MQERLEISLPKGTKDKYLAMAKRFGFASVSEMIRTCVREFNKRGE
jgi:hypothetical protein